MRASARDKINLLDRHFIPHGTTTTPPGTYTGRHLGHRDQGTATVPVKVTVWNFEFRRNRPNKHSDAVVAQRGQHHYVFGAPLMRNKVMGWYDPAGNASADVSNMGLNRSDSIATITSGFSATERTAAFPRPARSIPRRRISQPALLWTSTWPMS